MDTVKREDIFTNTFYFESIILRVLEFTLKYIYFTFLSLSL